MDNPNLSWSELQAAEAAQAELASHLFPIDITQPVPYPFHDCPVFVCVDIEAFERNQSLITEVGVATLDTLDLTGVAPGSNGRNWHSKIRARHFRILEYANLKNTDFVNGCPDRFEFGKSEFISKTHAPSFLADCFRHQHTEESNPMGPSTYGGTGHSTGPQKRNIILVGHDTNQDIQYMHKLGYNPLNLSNILEILDTAALFRAWKHELQSRSLGNIMYEFEMAGWNLHNAGNDAVYTLWIMLAIALRDAEMRGSKTLQKQRDETQKEKMQTAVQETIVRVMEENEGWSSEDGDDGGVPVRPKVDLPKEGLGEASSGNASVKRASPREATPGGGVELRKPAAKPGPSKQRKRAPLP